MHSLAPWTALDEVAARDVGRKNLLHCPQCAMIYQFSRPWQWLEKGHGIKTHKICGCVVAGISSGGIPGYCLRGHCTGNQFMLLPRPPLLQDALLFGAKNSFSPGCSRPGFFLLPD